MTKRAIDRLGAMSYGVLMLGIINGVFLSPIQNGLTHEIRGSLRVFILLMSVAVNGGGAHSRVLLPLLLHPPPIHREQACRRSREGLMARPAAHR